MKRNLFFAVLILALIFALVFGLRILDQNDAENGMGDAGQDMVDKKSAFQPTKKAEIPGVIRVDSPMFGATVKSPLVITGEASGSWFFEGSFPVYLLDASGKEIAATPAQSQEDWMTRDFVPFFVTLNFSVPEVPFGTLVLKKDNPSGLPEHDRELRIPVVFGK